MKFFMKLTGLLSLSFMFGVVTAFAGPTVDVRGKRTIRIIGEIGGGALDQAAAIEKLSGESTDPINLIINSPGGSVPAGLQLVEAVHIAQARGVTVRCTVTTLAASMAFILLSECDERYALANSLLLFHPARAFVFMGALKAEDARYMAEELEAINLDMIDLMEGSMGVVTASEKQWFDYHMKNETLWTASRLARRVPNKHWITIVSDVKADTNLFSRSRDGGNGDEAAVRNFIEQRSTK